MEIAGKVALITGAKRIGDEVARVLAARGADVALSYHRSREEAEVTAAAVRAMGRRAVAIAADVGRPVECERLVAAAVADLGRLDILVNMASCYIATPFASLTDDEFVNALAVDLVASFACARAAVGPMRAAGGGRIVNFADWTAASGRPRYAGYLPYYVAKRGVIALTEALALELAETGILVNAIAPGPIMPPADLDPDERRAVERATPVGRWGGPGAIAQAVVALVESDFITGEVIRVDGGRHLL